MSEEHREIDENAIAIVGMAARLPGASDVTTFWQNLRAGLEAIERYDDEQLIAAGVAPESLRDARYVKAGAPLEGMDLFDPEFFGFSPKEAAILDPQHRNFLECAWEALENASHDPRRFEGSIGVFAGCGMGAYFAFNLLTNRDLVEKVGLFLLRHTGNDKDFLATRVSYCFDLRGPSISVQTACSTSLVATHSACQSLLSGECDMALAGGVTIEIPHGRGYRYQEGEVLSPDGHCRAFDQRAEGTVFGSGAGVLVLRRMSDALADGDHVYALIKGTAINNDGSSKVGYLAPSVDQQAAAVAEALAVADVEADTIDYIECHGTGTAVGDPIEISALSEAFRETTARTGFCRIGSAKTNIGHLDTAAGVASLIKTALALHNKELPASLNYEVPNPNIEFETTPFLVNDRLTPWPESDHPRRAGVNSLGVGGTNAHAILEEAPERQPSSPATRPYQLIVLSARNRAALDAGGQRLAEHLRQNSELELADVAYTLFHGRQTFEQRRVLAARDTREAIELLESQDPRRVFTHKRPSARPSVCFLLPGGGAQHARMGRDLYDDEPVYRTAIERGLELLKTHHDLDLRPLLFASDEEQERVARVLERPSLQLPAIFIVEVALAELWISWGVQPAALLGHSMGENTAAHLAGVMTYGDALGLVALRGRLFETVPRGGMLSVALSAEELARRLPEELDLATVNSPENCVVSGPEATIERFAAELEAGEVEARRVPIAIAAHSRLLEPILEPFGDYLRGIELSAPKIPFVSNRTGTWIRPEEATDPGYWVAHLRHTVRFAEGVATLCEQAGRVLLEVGPGKTLSSLARQHPTIGKDQVVLSSLRHPDEAVRDTVFFVSVLGRLWAAEVELEHARLWPDERRLRVPLPTYAFQHQRYWIEPGELSAATDNGSTGVERIEAFDDWFYSPVWEPSDLPQSQAAESEPESWLVFCDDMGLGERLARELEAGGDPVVRVRPGDAFARLDENSFTLSPEHGRDGYDALLRELVASGRVPTRIAHLWSLTIEERFRAGSSFFHQNQERGFYSLFFLAQALGAEGLSSPVHLTVFSNGMQRVAGEALPYPEKATLIGPCRVAPRELDNLTASSVDIVLPMVRPGFLGPKRPRSSDFAPALELMQRELESPPQNGILAWRDGQRFSQTYQRGAPRPLSETARERLRPGGVYLITGGMGGIGLSVARFLAAEYSAKLILLGRTPLPQRSEWGGWLNLESPDHPTARRIRKVLELEELGAEVLLANCDVTDVEGLRALVQRSRERFGGIDGVFHAAGVVKDDLLQLKTQLDTEEVFTPKVHGTLVLEEALAGERLDFCVLFSSTSTATAPLGQIDYVGANAFLNAFAESCADRDGPFTVAVNWGVWNEVGMAAQAAEAQRGSQAGTPRASAPTAHPLFAARVRDQRGVSELTAHLSSEAHWLLDEHRTLDGAAIVPGTGYLELARAALCEYGEDGPFAIEDLFFFRPLYVPDGDSLETRVKLRQTETGYNFEVQSLCPLDDGRSGWQTHAQARLRLHAIERPESLLLSSIEARCKIERTPLDPAGHVTAQEQHLAFGPRWRVLREAAYGEGEALASLELPAEFAADLEHYALHPALVDIATGFAMQLIEGYSSDDGLWVPISYKRARFHAPLPRRIHSWVRSHGINRADGEFAHFDVTLTDEEGQVLFEVEEFAIRRLEKGVDFANTPRPKASELELVATADALDSDLSPAERALFANLERGITPSEGSAALRRILTGTPAPQILVTSLDLEALIAQAEKLAKGGDEVGTKFERPDLDSEYVEPSDEIERTLVGFWEELLGVEAVGVRDSFFDLGGHSLIAVRLFAKIKKAFQVDYPISILFEAPTIEGCAALIRETIQDGVQGSAAGGARSTGSSQAEPVQRTRYTHLVPMHPGEPADKTPFFLVAGMFGNVLNLRHLAHLIGTDRPFYGMQARGLYGDHQPHETFEEMAADYLAELRSVQPEGPYLLGGFSGGGITAYEMTRQLVAEGQEVALLAMLDTPTPALEELNLRDKLVIAAQKFRREGFPALGEWLQAKLRWKLARLLARFGDEVVEESSTGFASDIIEAAFRRAVERYELPHYDGPISLFRPKLDEAHIIASGRVTNRWRDFVYHDNGWSPHVASVSVHEVPGDHDSMVLEPNVRVLAARLREAIEAAVATEFRTAYGQAS